MKSNNIKIQPVRNRVAEIYTKVTGSNLIGELMMAAGNGTTETYKFVKAGFECEPVLGGNAVKYAAVAMLGKTVEDATGHTVTVKYGDDVATIPADTYNVTEVNAELAEEISQAMGEDYSAYIGWYLGNYTDQYDFTNGETYTFYVDGVEVATETGIDCEG